MLVPEGITLTVMPGVTIRFMEETYMLVEGTLLMSGTTDDPITCTADGNGRWRGIEISRKSGGSSRISHTLFERAFTALHIAAANSLELSWLAFDDNQDSGLYVYTGHPLFGGGVSELSVSNCSFQSNGKGVYAEGAGTIRISMSDFQKNGTGVNVDTWTSYISDSIFTNHTIVAIVNGGTSGVTASLTNNVINNNAGAIILGPFGEYELTYNQVSENGAPVHQVKGAIVILNSSMSGSIPIVRIQHNNFQNNISEQVIGVTGGLDQTVDARYNYWGTTDRYTIEALIWDYHDDFTLAEVLFEPFSESPDARTNSP